MPAALGALGNDDVRASRGGAFGLGHGRHHVHDQRAGVVRAGEVRAQVLVGPGPGGRDHPRADVERGGEAVLLGHEQQVVEPKRPPGSLDATIALAPAVRCAFGS